MLFKHGSRVVFTPENYETIKRKFYGTVISDEDDGTVFVNLDQSIKSSHRLLKKNLRIH